MDETLVFLTEEMVCTQVEEVLTGGDPLDQEKENKLYILQHILDLLREGKLLTINDKKEIKLWKGEKNLQ